ncbi:MAG TPA: NAD(+)/NADH kinase [bacterium]|nr:NAD(+)/NADH kinase [bacterium]
MKNRKVLVIYKESAYSQFQASGSLTKGLKKGDYLAVVRGSHDRHHRTLAGVLKALAAEGLPVDRVLRHKAYRLRNVDHRYALVVSVGGDGTLLDASHLVERVPILGVNSDPMRSVARFSGCRLEDFPQVLRGHLEGRTKPVPVPRLQFRVNGRPNPWRVLNDLLVCTASPAGTSRYFLEIGDRSEEQMSSGIWVSTAAGSSAAIFSAGGKAQSLTSRSFQFLVREPYQRKFGVRRLVRGILRPGQRLGIVSRMKEGRIFVDGPNLWLPFRLGDRLEVGPSKSPLRLIGVKG